MTAAGAAEPQERVPSAYTDPAASLHEKLAVRVAAPATSLMGMRCTNRLATKSDGRKGVPQVAVHPLNGPLTHVGGVTTVVGQLMPVWHGPVMVAGEVVGQELGAIVCPNSLTQA